MTRIASAVICLGAIGSATYIIVSGKAGDQGGFLLGLFLIAAVGAFGATGITLD